MRERRASYSADLEGTDAVIAVAAAKSADRHRRGPRGVTKRVLIELTQRRGTTRWRRVPAVVICGARLSLASRGSGNLARRRAYRATKRNFAWPQCWPRHGRPHSHAANSEARANRDRPSRRWCVPKPSLKMLIIIHGEQCHLHRLTPRPVRPANENRSGETQRA